jgi:hypothetical protein
LKTKKEVRKMDKTRIFDLRDLDMGDAYDYTQCGPVRHGDVLLVTDGVAIMYRAWPVMVTGISDVFHSVSSGSTWQDMLAKLSYEHAHCLAGGLELAELPVAELAARAVDAELV